MLNALVQRKRILAFYFCDLSRDGEFKCEDLETFGKAVAAELGVEAGSERYAQIVGAYRGYWDAFGAPADLNGNGSVTLEEFLTNVSNLLALPDAKAMMTLFNQGFFDVIDLDGSGTISLKEFTTFLKPAGISAEQAQEAFRHLDRDGGGFITKDEFAENTWEYWTSEDPAARGNWMYG